MGKSFPMSWVQAWEDWLLFDNGRGAGSHPGAQDESSTTLLNKDSIDSTLGVLMMGTAASWYECPLNLVNLYGFGRLSWNTSLTKGEIYEEWLGLTFGTMQPSTAKPTTAAVRELLALSERVATELGIYHG